MEALTWRELITVLLQDSIDLDETATFEIAENDYVAFSAVVVEQKNVEKRSMFLRISD